MKGQTGIRETETNVLEHGKHSLLQSEGAFNPQICGTIYNFASAVLGQCRECGKPSLGLFGATKVTLPQTPARIPHRPLCVSSSNLHRHRRAGRFAEPLFL